MKEHVGVGLAGLKFGVAFSVRRYNVKVTVTLGLFPPGIADVDIHIGYIDTAAAAVNAGAQLFPAGRKVAPLQLGADDGRVIGIG